ncbi:cyclin-dependent kinase inhibitor 1C-like [Triticum aestivum]|uniref:cyclin-dependent kinase inhibitor 1C-like n=1 Tax=Triticum aestivum TaxID=4565 RepID=UPI001D013CCA|nr:cyclin-dependent kinase inhibitor 1C-like [Triticum aestivum]XP_044352344.1 cyclin-dependent kinase inhibitor 1C-like [Triticum aestivum]
MAADAAYAKLVLLACNGGVGVRAAPAAVRGVRPGPRRGRARLPAPAPLHAPTPAPPPPRARRRHRAQAPSLAAGPTHRQDQGQHHPVHQVRGRVQGDQAGAEADGGGRAAGLPHARPPRPEPPRRQGCM